jgi:uncharacterized protein YbjT (DUF2867 family)
MIDDLLVLGGSGFVGRSFCARWVDRRGGGGGTVRVPTRRPTGARPLQLLPTVHVVNADVHDDAQLARLVAGRDAVVNLIAILHGDAAAFERVHVELPRRLARACLAAGVRRVVHVGALGASPDAPSRYLRSKAAGEQVLRDAGLDLTVLRPSVIYGAEDRLLNLFARLQALLPIVPLAGAESRYQPVWVEDVAEAMVRCLEQPQTIGATIECTGPTQVTLRELVQLAGRCAGHPRRVVALPASLARAQAFVLECLPGEPLMSRDNLDSMRVPSIATGAHPGLDLLGIRAAALETIAPQMLGRRQGPARLEPWRMRRG